MTIKNRLQVSVLGKGPRLGCTLPRIQIVRSVGIVESCVDNGAVNLKPWSLRDSFEPYG